MRVNHLHERIKRFPVSRASQASNGAAVEFPGRAGLGARHG